MRVLTLISLLTLVSCGGQVEQRPEEQENSPTGDAGKKDGGWSGTPLGDCKPGFPRGSPDEPCPWVVEGTCYPTKHDACNCACPPDHDSLCVSGSPGSYVEVSCF